MCYMESPRPSHPVSPTSLTAAAPAALRLLLLQHLPCLQYTGTIAVVWGQIFVLSVTPRDINSALWPTKHTEPATLLARLVWNLKSSGKLGFVCMGARRAVCA